MRRNPPEPEPHHCECPISPDYEGDYTVDLCVCDELDTAIYEEAMDLRADERMGK